MCGALERGGSTALPDKALRNWLDGSVDIVKPDLPRERGQLTIADIDAIDDSTAFGAAMEYWSRSVWETYAELHGTARHWLDLASAAGPVKQRRARR